MNEFNQKRNNLNSFFFSIAILAIAGEALLSLSELIGLINLERQVDNTKLLIYGLFCILFVIFSVALLFMKKWGMYGIVIFGLLYAILRFMFFETGDAVFYRIPMGGVFFAALFIWRHYGLIR
jgi:hypothetical protein